MSGSTMGPHDKMRAQVARGEQAPRPPRRTPNVARPPPPSSTTTPEEAESTPSQRRRCYETYHEYQRCVEEKGGGAEACKKLADNYKSSCPDWIGSWSIK
ncbi:putative cytochrome c oxidase subunit 6b-like [Salvia splendens]|uniref:putative cytochrome c oxidase subunit 6b-like n=1 Tax=Salvia splendens TaxID=180675 RepID=UPI001C262BCE|nr:putative cytochrome c oxidase subunit 6b-like [Salvia splendens]